MSPRKPPSTVLDIEITAKLCETLPEPERSVVLMRNALLDGHSYTFAAIGKLKGTGTPSNTMRIYNKALEMIKENASLQQYQPGTEIGNQALQEVAEMFPTLSWVPNMAQRRIVEPWRKAPYPFMVVASCGNGTGKTDSLPQDIVGCLMGPEFLCDLWNYDENGVAIGGTDFQYYEDCRELREKGEFCYRILCGPDDMKENGSLYMAIKKYIPTAVFKGKMSTGAYKQIEIALPGNQAVKNYIDIKTFDQDVVAQAGANLHRIAINEPPPFSVWSETIARIRSHKDQLQCTILMNATILDHSTWVFDLEKDSFFDGKIKYVQGSIYENVAGEDITKEVADECEQRLGYRFKVDPVTGHFITYGHLSMESVQIQIHNFEMTDPNQIEARIWGANVQLVGAEFKNFSKAVHVRPQKIVPSGCPVIQIVDPHPVKNDMSAWAWIDAMGRRRYFQEWPEKPWEKMKSRDVDITGICAQWDELEYRLGIKDKIVARIGDPNRFKTSDSRDLNQLWMLYAPHGYMFDLFVNDNLDYGHQIIHSSLYFNKASRALNPEDPMAWPKLTISENCCNLISSMLFYGRKALKDATASVSETIDKKFKDGMDLIRYGEVWLEHRSYYELVEKMKAGGGGSDYEKIKASRGDYGDYGPPSTRESNRQRSPY